VTTQQLSSFQKIGAEHLHFRTPAAGQQGQAERIIGKCKAMIVSYGIGAVREQPGKPYWADSDWTVGIGRMTSTGMGLLGVGADLVWNVRTPLVGRHNAYNIAAVLAAADILDVPASTVLAALDTATGAPGRLQPVVPADSTRDAMPFQVFVDYAHTHDSLENVLKALRATMGNGKLLCVFGCGGDRDRTKRPKMGAVAERLADRVIVTSDNPRTEDPQFILGEICKGFSGDWRASGKIMVDADRRSAIRTAIGMASEEDVVLIAGKGHENYQIIGTTKHHFDDVEEAQAALAEKLTTNAHK